ncbi:MAG: hypothetical protein ACRDWV_00745 [Acidimicrobiales bacterium]
MFRFALEFMGEDTPKGRDFADRWKYPGFRHAFRVMTGVWGVAFGLEAVATFVIAEYMSTASALSFNRIAPYALAGVLVAWMSAYGQIARRKGERLAASRG